MKIYLGTDHRGFLLKEALKQFLGELGHLVEDKGAFSMDPTDDYPDFVIPVAREVQESNGSALGIIIGATGQGEAMVANRIKGVRAVVYYGGPKEILTMSKEHNNANIISLGALFLDEASAKEAVKLWIETSFSGNERHIRRLAKF